MTLLRPEHLDADDLTYRIFGLGRDNVPWRAEEVIGSGPFVGDERHAELAWRLSSRAYYAEQAGLVAAVSLATATADEARHADAFYQYARKIGGGEPEECLDRSQPLDDMLHSLPYLGKAAVHTLLEGLAADEFILLRDMFDGDALGRLYHLVRQDEIRHIAIGMNYLCRELASPAGRDAWAESGAEWLATGIEITGLERVARSLGELAGRDPGTVHRWFLHRHRTRLRAVGIELPEGGDR
jgi:hypothetical protein